MSSYETLTARHGKPVASVDISYIVVISDSYPQSHFYSVCNCLSSSRRPCNRIVGKQVDVDRVRKLADEGLHPVDRAFAVGLEMRAIAQRGQFGRLAVSIGHAQRSVTMHEIEAP